MRKQRIKKQPFPIFKLFFIGIIICIGYCYHLYANFQSKTLFNKSEIIKIEAGDTFGNLPKKLPALNSFWYKVVLKLNPPTFALEEGRYQIQKDSDLAGLYTSLQTPIYKEEKITILEGWNIYDIDEYLTAKKLIAKGDYIQYTTNPGKIQALKKYYPFLDTQKTFEGYLYPDTYTVVATNFQINEFVTLQLDTFENKVYKPLLTNLSNKRIYDLVNLASIVEKEEKNTKNKPVVAGILKKRLQNNWMIGADITVCYPHELTAQECKMVISKYINEKSEYNTRTMKGLPKTPIGNPSYETIYATLNDEKTDYWFYLHDVKTGQIYYGKTNADHQANIEKYLR